MMSDNEMLRKICLSHEKKLIKLMGKKRFIRYSTNLAKNLFAAEVFDMPDGEFKDFIIDNFNLITGGDDQ